MKTILTFILMCSITLSFAQTSKEEVVQIIKEQSDGIPGQKVTSSTVYNDTKEGIKTVYGDAKQLSPKIGQAVESIAKELKTGANNVWTILVRQQLVWSIVFLILTISSILNWIFFYYRLNKRPEVKYEKVTKQVQKFLLIEGTKEEDSLRYPHSYGPKAKTVEEEFLEKVPTNEIKWLIPLHLTICLTLSGLSIYHFSDMMTGFMNPEYSAMKTIVEVAYKLK